MKLVRRDRNKRASALLAHVGKERVNKIETGSRIARKMRGEIARRQFGGIFDRNCRACGIDAGMDASETRCDLRHQIGRRPGIRQIELVGLGDAPGRPEGFHQSKGPGFGLVIEHRDGAAALCKHLAYSRADAAGSPCDDRDALGKITRCHSSRHFSLPSHSGRRNSTCALSRLFFAPLHCRRGMCIRPNRKGFRAISLLV